MHTATLYSKGLRLFLFVFCILEITGSSDLCSQTYFFDNYSTKQGFESKVYSVTQDEKHYIWLGTQTGLSRFDGISFISYSVEHGLAEGGVRIVFIDRNNNLWMGHEGGGITRYNGKIFEKINLGDSLLKSNITSITQDADNQLWITTASDGALMIKNPDDASAFIEYVHHLKGKSLGDMVFGSLVTSKGEVYFITNVGIHKYNKSDNSFERYLPKQLSTYFSPTVMFEDSRGNLWFGTYNGGLSKLDSRENKIQEFDTQVGLASNWVTSITEDREGNIWIGHWKGDGNKGGISRIDPSGNITIFNTSNGLHDDHIWCIKEDAEGNILIGTTEQGLDIFKGERFVSFSDRDGLLHNQVKAITEDPEGQIWFGTDNGISVFTGADKTPPFIHFTQSNKFISNQPRFFRKDSRNNIWIGTADEGVLLYNTSRKQFITQTWINSYIPYHTVSRGITALEIDNQDHMWVGTLDGLFEYDIMNDRTVTTHTQGAGLAGNQITALYTDSRGDLWIGSYLKGLTRLHQGIFTIIKNVAGLSPTCIVEDKQHKIWVGTSFKGVLMLDNDSVKQYGTAEGLLSNLVNLLVCDEHNNIYVGTNHGLNKIDQHTQKIYSYNRMNGFTGDETNSNAWCFDNLGSLWVGTAEGAIRCNLDLLAKDDSTAPVVQINEMLVKGLPVEMISGMRFPSSENDITFKYISISLKNPGGIMYQVMLEGLHDNWQNQKNATSISFIKLQPGRYTLKIRARNDHSDWTAVPVTFSFRILPPFYRRLSFILSVVILVLGALVAYIKIRERNLVREKKILEDKVEERTHALSDANEQLSMRNRDITDSINYAKRIQFSILPPDIPFDNTFILFKPKDIVSGDFYWMNTAGGREFLAAVDCTGHGVPGAFMSFIGYTSLNKIIIEQGIYQPSAILNRLNEEVATTLHQKGEAIVNDGMDIALICYSPENGKLEYAGAFNPLIVLRKKEVIEVKADRFAIGRATGKDKNFTNHELQVEKGDMIYLYSDGYADQFGGPEGKKFKTSALKELFLNICHLNVDQQQKLLDTSFEDWKVGQNQIDDVLILGRRF